MKIILASASPRRRELLDQAGIIYEVYPSTMEEQLTGGSPDEIVMKLAKQKALDVFTQFLASACCCSEAPSDFLVIGADTIVVCDGTLLGKPKDAQDAESILALLSNRSHDVYTGVSMIYMKAGHKTEYTFYDRTGVSMYPITKHQAQWYIKTGEPMDKAGAYGIQGKGAVFIREIEGDYNNVVGLPLSKVWQYIDREHLLDGFNDID